MFIEFVKDGVKNSDNKPEKAIVESIEVVDEDYKGNIRTTGSYSRWLANDQLSKMVGAGLDMLEIQGKMLGKQDETIKEIRNGFDNTTKKQRETIKEIRNGFDKVTKKLYVINSVATRK